MFRFKNSKKFMLVVVALVCMFGLIITWESRVLAQDESEEGPQITGFLVGLGYFVGPNEEEWYSQGVIATVYHPEGSDEIESFIAIDPTGKELPTITDECSTTTDSWIFMWNEGNFPDPPTFGTYTVIATDKDGRADTVTSWPTDHVSDIVPIITNPVNHGYVATRVPTFRWEPFSGRTTGYLIEVSGPPEETLPDDDAVWRIGLPAGQTEVQFNSDGTAAIPRLTPGNTYRLLVFAWEAVCYEIQCYRDASIRCIEFTVKPLTIEIDIKPGSFPNSVNPKSKGVIPVAILSTESFDATTVDPLSVAFGPEGAMEVHGQGHLEDADKDGDLDLILHFNTQDTGIQCGDDVATLTGKTFEGQDIMGSDSIVTVGCK